MFRGDIRDPAAVRRALEGVSVVHHNVAMVPLAKDKEAFWSVNRDGTRHLLDAAVSAKVRKVVHMSSSAVFGAPDRNPVDERTPPRPQEDYGRAKLGAEDLCHEHSARGLDVTIIRPRTIMGHGRLGIMQILFEWVRQGRNIPVLGRGDNQYQFVHADDLADAAIAAAARPGSTTYNVGAEKFGTMRDTLEGLVRHAAHGEQGRFGADGARRRDDEGLEPRRRLAARGVPLAHVRPLDVLRSRARPRASSAGRPGSATWRCSATPTTGTCATATRSSRGTAPRTTGRRSSRACLRAVGWALSFAAAG